MYTNYNNTFQDKCLTNITTFNTGKCDYELKYSQNIFKIKDSIPIHNYLRCRKWEYDNDDFQLILENNILKISKKIDKETLNGIKDDIEKNNLDKIYTQNINKEEYTIGTLQNIDDLIEDTYNFINVKESIKNSDKLGLSPYIFKFRKLKHDGNSFYRGIIFFFLEYIIFSKNIMLLKEFLYIFNEKMSYDNPKIAQKEYLKEGFKKIDRETVISILYLMIIAMEKSDKDIYGELSEYKILLKAFLKSEAFDYSMIYFTRYLIYEFILENENQTLLKGSDAKMGNLLSMNYILNKEGQLEFLFEDYYKKLMTMNEKDESIDLFIVPYVFKCNLNILIYKYGNEDSIFKEKPNKCGKSTDLEINLLLKDDKYDIYYKKYYYEKNYRLMDILIYDNKKESNIFTNNINDNNNEKSKSNNDRTFLRHNTYKIEGNYSSGININMKNPYKQNNLSISASNNNQKRLSNATEKIKNLNYNKINSSNNNLPACLQCNNSYSHNENVFSLCKDCLKLILKDKILSAYLIFLQKGYTKDCEKKFNNYISTIKCSISNQHNIYLDTAIHNSGFRLKDLFSEIKQSMCIYCAKNVDKNNYYLELSCGCKICTKNCFEKYIKNIEEMNRLVLLDEKDDIMSIIPMTECQCGFKYDLKAFLKMINEMNNRNEKSFRKIYEEQIKNNWKWICMVCRENFKKKTQYFRLYMNDDKLDKELLKKYELKHLICNTCCSNNDISNIKHIYCNFCKSDHKIDNLKKVDSGNKTETACIII